MNTTIEKLNPGMDQPRIDAKQGLLAKSLWFLLFLTCGAAIYVFGSNYFDIFPTQNNVYRFILAGLFLVVAVTIRKTSRLHQYWSVFYAFFVATSVFIATSLLAGPKHDLLVLAGLDIHTIQGQAIDKWVELGIVAVTILGLSKAAGFSLDALYLRKGNLKIGAIIGIGLFLNYVTAAILVAGSNQVSANRIGEVLTWGTIFAFANGFLEELWLRGVFLKKLLPLSGAAGAIVLTSLFYSLLHFGSTYLTPAATPFFLVNTFTLGVAMGYVVYKSGSLWGAVIMHAAADIFLLMAIGI